MTPEELSTAIVGVLTTLSDDGALTLPDGVPATVTVERPRQKGHGDYATNIAMQLAKKAGDQSARSGGADQHQAPGAGGHRRRRDRRQGFLNISVAADAQGKVAADVVAAGDAYGRNDTLSGERINVEFISANPRRARCTSATPAGPSSATLSAGCWSTTERR